MKKIVIFGAGSASLYPMLGMNTDNYEIVGVIDNDSKKWHIEWLGFEVESPNVLENMEYDYIVISHIYGKEARKQLLEMGVIEDKIIDFYGNLDMFFDVRIPVMKTCALELQRNCIEGNMAEVGVFQGEFSRHLNSLFPQKKLYLFDTFEGFDEKDISEKEKEISNPKDSEFKNTSIELVMSRMENPSNVIVRKGYFPESLQGLEDEFCLVSIDPDLYLPTLNALEYFYPRLVKGGYIFIHDYNNRRFAGVKQAVEEYCKDKNISRVPICDVGGTLIITK